MKESMESVRWNMWMPRWLHRGLTNFAELDGRDAADVVRQLVSEWIVYKKSAVQYRGFSDKPSDMIKGDDEV